MNEGNNRLGGAANAFDADARPRGRGDSTRGLEGPRQQRSRGRTRRGLLFAASLMALALAGGVAACGGSSDDGASGDTGGSGGVDLIAYSTPQTAYEESIIPAFQETPEGEGVEFSSSFASSGDQSRAVEAGQPADFVHLPLEPDITRLVDAGLVSENWNTEEYDGKIQDSVVAFIVRPGNPKDIQDWDDLLRDDVDVITPNPFTSGGARWNIMAAYGQVIQNGGSEEEALDFVQQMLENTVVQDASARDSLNTFLGGQGDVALSYENEAIGAIDAGEDLEYLVPDDTILIETLGVIPTDAENADTATAFRDFLISEEGQRLFAESGYRPVDEKVLAEFEDEFPTPKGLFEIDEFGGWEKVAVDFFDPENGSIAHIERELGVATE
jgi:sulfate transport system substrate-binding protein